MEHLSDASFLGKLLELPANDRLDWKVIASYEHSSLFGLVFSNEGKKFYDIDTRCSAKPWLMQTSPLTWDSSLGYQYLAKSFVPKNDFFMLNNCCFIVIINFTVWQLLVTTITEDNYSRIFRPKQNAQPIMIYITTWFVKKYISNYIILGPYFVPSWKNFDLNYFLKYWFKIQVFSSCITGTLFHTQGLILKSYWCRWDNAAHKVSIDSLKNK